MRRIPLFFALALACSGCGAGPDRTLPRSSLVARAWAGREPPTSPRAAAVVAFAYSQIGKRYCWGGTGPRCFDCSGLVQRAWSLVGVRLPRTSEAMAEELVPVPLEGVRAGDVLWWPGHVGIYAGNGWVVDAYDSRHGVVRRPAVDAVRAFRPPAETVPAVDGSPLARR